MEEMNNNDTVKITIEEFSRLQGWMKMVDDKNLSFMSP